MSEQSRETTKMKLKTEIQNYHRDAVRKLLQEGALDQISDKAELFPELVGLRDQDILNFLVKKYDTLDPNWLNIDLSNSNNKVFVQEALKKYRKKIKWSDPAACKILFDIAMEAEDTETLKYMISQKKAAESWPLLAAGTRSCFQLLLTQGIRSWNPDQQVEVFVNAALAPDGLERLQDLVGKGLDPACTNSDGKNAQQLLEKQLKDIRYPKNKSGEARRLQHQNAQKYLYRATYPTEETDTGASALSIKLKKYAPFLIGGAGILVLVLCLVLHNTSKTGTETSSADEAQTEAILQTDTSLVVENGDTVNIDFIGTIDGVEFDGGSTDGSGTDLEIGSGTYVDDFEEQLIGHNVGDVVSVEVTFPEDYASSEVAGKDAVFETTINGIYR